MSNQNVENIKMVIRNTINWNKPLDEVRKDLKVFGDNTKLPTNIIIKKMKVNHSKVELIIPDEVTIKELLLYIHGGGYCLGIVNTNRAFVSKIALELGIKTMLLDYRLAPENPYPDGLNDFVNLYMGLVEEGYDPKRILIMADSSGCGLTLSGLQILKSKNFELPRKLAFISPVVDLAKTGESFKTKKERDPYQLLDEFFIDNNYIKDLDPKDPSISPIYGSLRGFTPMIIHGSESDVFFSDSQKLYNKAKEEGVKVTYQEFDGLWHNFHMSAEIIPEGQAALEEIYKYLKE